MDFVNTFRAAGNKNCSRAVYLVAKACSSSVQDVVVVAPGMFHLSVCGVREATDSLCRAEEVPKTSPQLVENESDAGLCVS
jgi:hypothetical protein